MAQLSGGFSRNAPLGTRILRPPHGPGRASAWGGRYPPLLVAPAPRAAAPLFNARTALELPPNHDRKRAALEGDIVPSTLVEKTQGSVSGLFPEGAEPELPPGFFQPGFWPKGERSSFGRGGVMGFLMPGGLACYYREYRHGGLFAGFRGSRYASDLVLRRELEDSIALQAKGICVPQVVAGRVERAVPGGKIFSLALITEKVEGSVLFDLLEKSNLSHRARLMRAAGEQISLMHRAGFRHRDLHPGNLIASAQGRITILDLEGGSWGGTPGDASSRENLTRFARYIEKHAGIAPSLRDVLALLGGYEPDRAKRRALFRVLARAYSREVRWHRLGWRLFGRGRGAAGA